MTRSYRPARKSARSARSSRRCGAELGDDLHQAERREPFHRVADGRAGRGHARAAQGLDHRLGVAGSQRPDDAGAVEVARGLAGGDEDARGGSRDHPARGRRGAATPGRRRPPGAPGRGPPALPRRARRPPARPAPRARSCGARAGARRPRAPASTIRSTTSDERLAGAGPPVAPHPHELADAAGEIERQIAVGLEQPEAADPLPRDPAGGGQRDRAVGELDPRVGEVQVRAQQRQPRRAHLGGLGAAGEVQHQVEIVDHEVEHDGDVGAARLERRQPLALDVAGSVEIGLGRAERAVVALDVARPGAGPRSRPRRGDERVGLGHRRRQRLLHQHRDAALERPEPDRGVRRRGHRDRHGLRRVEQRVEVGEARGAELRRRRPAARSESRS